MGFFSKGHVKGEFRHKETGAWFEYRPCTHECGLRHGFLHEIAVDSRGIAGDWGFRFATVLATVVIVSVDEDEKGFPVTERWSIKNHRRYE